MSTIYLEHNLNSSCFCIHIHPLPCLPIRKYRYSMPKTVTPINFINYFILRNSYFIYGRVPFCRTIRFISKAIKFSYVCATFLLEGMAVANAAIRSDQIKNRKKSDRNSPSKEEIAAIYRIDNRTEVVNDFEKLQHIKFNKFQNELANKKRSNVNFIGELN